MEQVKELVGFLVNENPAVRLQAVEMLAGLSAKVEQVPIVVSVAKDDPDLIKNIQACMQEDKLSKLAISALINYAQNEEFSALLGTVPFVDAVMKCFNRKQFAHTRLLMMLLANATRSDEGQRALMQAGTPLEGLHLIRLVNQFVAPATEKQPTKKGQRKSKKKAKPTEDDMGYMAHTLTNVTRLGSASRTLLDPKRGLMKKIVLQLDSSSEMRRLGVLQAIRNCFFTAAHHATLLDPAMGLMHRLLVPLVGHANVPDEEDQEGMLPEVRAAYANKDKEYEQDKHVRKLILECILLLARVKEARTYLKSIRTYVVVRELHNWERELPDNKEIDEFIEDDLIQFFILEEEEGEAAPKIEVVEDGDEPPTIEEACAVPTE